VGGCRFPMSALGQKQTCAVHQPMSALPLIATSADVFQMSAKGPEADVRSIKSTGLRYGCFCCFGCLAAVALAWAIFVFSASTRRSAPLIGIARDSSEPDWLRGFRITAFPAESVSILMLDRMVATFWF